jgi:hypothetical protein
VASSMTEFIGNISSDNLAMDAAHYFDEIAVLYNVIGTREDIEICSDGNAKFTLLTDSEHKALSLFQMLNDMIYTVYGYTYRIQMTCSGDRVFVELILLKKVASGH